MPDAPITAPPPIRRNAAKRLTLIACAVISAILLIVVLMNLDDPSRQTEQADLPSDVPELLPGPMDPPAAGSPDVRFQGNTWIQVADASGSLAQQYRFEGMEPNPDGTYTMQSPEAQFFLSGGRVLEFSGIEAVVRAPNQALESGAVEGDVIIRLFEPAQGNRAVDPARDQPAVLVRTTRASFHNTTGIVRCAGEVSVHTNRAELSGRDLRIHINEAEGIAEWLSMPGEVQVRLAGSAVASSPAAATHEPAARRRTEPSADPGEATFYRLTFTGDVRIRQQVEDVQRLVRGEELLVIFSTAGGGLDEIVTLAPHEGAMAHRPRRSVHAALHGSVFTVGQDAPASVARNAADDDIIITCTDGMNMRPLRGIEWVPDDPRETVLELHGTPVTLDDPATGTRATCPLLRYEAVADRLELAGNDAMPVQVESPQLTATGLLAWYQPRAGRGGFEGAGTLYPQVETPDPGIDEGATNPPVSPPIEELRITWQQGVELAFAENVEGTETGRLKSAIFRGDVDVTSEALNFGAEEMIVGFDTEAETESQIRSIDANGHVAVRSLDPKSPGRLRSSNLSVEFLTTAGRAAPHTMIAFGHVEAADESQTIWAERIEVTFVEPDSDAPVVEEVTTGAAAIMESEVQEASPATLTDRLGGAEIASFIATEQVQVLLSDRGTRVFADRLEGDGQTREIVLTGENVRIFDGRHVFDRGRRLILSEVEQLGRVEGPGQFRLFDRPIIAPEQKDRLPSPPAVEASLAPSVRVRWSDAMNFDGAANESAGALTFDGAVDALVHQSELEEQRMSGGHLALDFQREEGIDPSAVAPSDEETPPTDVNDDRRIVRLVARGDAKLENTTWEQPDHSDEPRVFYVAGEHVEFDDRSEEARVLGAGTLLIHDPRAEEAAVSETGADANTDPPPEQRGGVALSGRGTTSLAWTDGLHLAPTLDGFFNLEVKGNIEMRHRAPDETIATLTCHLLEARMQRAQREEPGTEPADTIDFGGHADLERIQASGDVLVRTEQREINCHVFDYKPRLGVAEVLAAPGRRATVRRRGEAAAARFERAVWDLTRDRFTVTGVSGGG